MSAPFQRALRTTLALAVASAPALSQVPCLAQDLMGADTDGDRYGFSLAVSGDDLLIGAPREDVDGPSSGGVYRYRITSTGVQFQERWPGTANAGTGVAIHSGWAAYNNDTGTVLTYQRVGTDWNPVPLQASGSAAFGNALAIDAGPDPRVAVADPFASPAQIRVFRLINGTWFQEDTLTVPNENPPPFSSVAMLNGATIFAGSPTAMINGAARGAVYVFQRSGGTWNFTQRLAQTGLAPNARFGESIAANGSSLAIGAPGTTLGTVVTYVRPGGPSWVFDSFLSMASSNGFGQDVALLGTRLAATSSVTGEVGFFTRSQGTWNFAGRLDLGTPRVDSLVLAAGEMIAGHSATGAAPGRAYAAYFTGEDCNNNGATDLCEIYAGTQADANGNGVLDSCECGERTNFCASNPNSSGNSARLFPFGQPSVSGNLFSLRATLAPASKPGLFFYGGGEIQVPFGDGFRCVSAGGAGLFRLNPPVMTNASGVVDRHLDFTQGPANAGPGRIAPFSTWKFQFWFRDPMGPGGSGFNLTDGLSVTFCP